jgi:tellurite resistance protein
MASFVTRIMNRLRSLQMGSLEPEEKRAVVALMHAVVTADGELSIAELAELNGLEKKLGVIDNDRLDPPEAVAVLARNERALKLACLVVADAFFVDGDYDETEQAFVADFASRFGLPMNPLQQAVEVLRKRKIDDVLADWNHEINKS